MAMAIAGKAATGIAGKVLGVFGKRNPQELGQTVALEALKYGAIVPLFYASGLADPMRGKRMPAAGAYPAAAPPVAPALTLQQQVLYGDPGKAGLFGSSHWMLGGSARSPGLIERQFEANDAFRNRELSNQLESQRIQTGADVQRQRLISTTQQILGREQASRDKYSSRQNTFSNFGANTANIFAGAAGMNVAATYGSPMVMGNDGVAPIIASQQIQRGMSPMGARRPGGFGNRVPRGGFGAAGAPGIGAGGYGGGMM